MRLNLAAFTWPAYALLLAAVVAGVALLPATPASAEDQRTVGRYHVTAAWAKTPVYPDESNGLVLRVVTDTGQPATGLESSLRLRIGVPNQVTETWNLEPVAGEPGMYKVQLALPRAGTYFMDLFGTLDGQQVYERFISGQHGLEKVLAHDRSYPRGAAWVIALTFGGYLIGLAIFVGRGAFKWYRRTHRATV